MAQATQADIMRARLHRLEKSPLKETIATGLRTVAKSIGTAEIIVDLIQTELIAAFDDDESEPAVQQSDEV